VKRMKKRQSKKLKKARLSITVVAVVVNEERDVWTSDTLIEEVTRHCAILLLHWKDLY